MGIGYSVSGSLKEINHQVFALRTRDFLPVVDEPSEKAMRDFFLGLGHVESGGGNRFLQFIRQELIPMIDTTYRTDPTDRTLIGHSWGGLFALYTLFQQPSLFQRYVVVSPDFYFGDGLILRWERGYAALHQNLPVNLYLAFGDYELNAVATPRIESFGNAVRARQYSKFQFAYQVIGHCKHCGVTAPAFQAGLSKVFDML